MRFMSKGVIHAKKALPSNDLHMVQNMAFGNEKAFVFCFQNYSSNNSAAFSAVSDSGTSGTSASSSS